MTSIDLQRLTREEKLRIMHALWEDLAREESAVESPAWHGDALRETAERVRSGNEKSHNLEEAKRELRKRAE